MPLPQDRPSPDTIARLRYEAGAKSLLLAYLIWFFLGYGGVHRMYLGRWVSGTIMLLLLLVSWALTILLVGFIGLGLIMLWWLLDALLLPGMVSRSNDALVDSLTR